MPPSILLGIDPGAFETGIVLLVDEEVAKASVVRRDRQLSRGAYVVEIIDTVKDFLSKVKNPTVCVEDVVKPKPFYRGKQSFVNVSSIIDTSIVLGAVLAHYPKAIVCPPGHNGQGDLASYPPALVGKHEKSGKGGTRRHARSAYDCCLTVIAEQKAKELV
jgi:hypothetical protein